MAATPKQMAAQMDTERFQKITSVTAHMVQSIAVQMSVTEMETLIDSFGVPNWELSDTAKAVQREFATAVHDLR